MISVIIPAYNEEDSISATLQSLVSQKYSKKFEVILIDNNSSDNTSKVASKFKNKLNLKIIKEKRQGRGNARATGAEHAKGDILAYIDADTIASEGWLAAIERGLDSRLRGNDKRIVAITGHWDTDDVEGFTKWFLTTFQEISQFPYRLLKGHFWLNGMNMAITREAYDKCGGFKRSLNAHEDIDITNRLSKIGKIEYLDDMRVVSSGRRYKNGLASGLFSYQKTAFQYFWLGKQKVNLENKR